MDYSESLFSENSGIYIYRSWLPFFHALHKILVLIPQCLTTFIVTVSHDLWKLTGQAFCFQGNH